MKLLETRGVVLKSKSSIGAVLEQFEECAEIPFTLQGV